MKQELVEQKVAERERERAAFHEAGHALVCMLFGGIGSARIWRNSEERVRLGEKAWLGQFHMIAEPRTLSEDKVPANWREQLGAAGLVAELMLEGIVEPSEIASEVEAVIDNGDASASDLQLMGGFDFNLDHVYDVVDLLNPNWAWIKREAELCIAEAASECAAACEALALKGL